MTRRPYGTSRRDSLDKQIKVTDSVGYKPDHPIFGDAALADHLVEGRRCVELAADFVSRYSYDTFMSDPHVQNAGSMLIVRLREVVNRLPDEFKNQHPSIPWTQIRGMGNIVAHQYAIRADPDMIWDALNNDFPRLDMLRPD